MILLAVDVDEEDSCDEYGVSSLKNKVLATVLARVVKKLMEFSITASQIACNFSQSIIISLYS